MIATPKETRRFSMSSVETMGVIEPRRCGQCFKMFQPQKYGQIYCSYACRDWCSATAQMVSRGWCAFWEHRNERPPKMQSAPVWCAEDVEAALHGNWTACFLDPMPRCNGLTPKRGVEE